MTGRHPAWANEGLVELFRRVYGPAMQAQAAAERRRAAERTGTAPEPERG